MRTQDVKFGKQYLYKGEVVHIVERISGKITNKPNMQSGIMFTGFKHQRKKFLLSNGDTVYSDKLSPII